MAATTTNTSDAVEGVPVSTERVRVCRDSANFWVHELPRYADRQQASADFWSILAGILAAITSLAIFPVVANDSGTLVKVLVSAFALAAAICALVPRVKNYAELAGQARELTSRYGGVLGNLIDLGELKSLDKHQARAVTVVTEFSSIKEKKDMLRGLPDRQKVEAQRANWRRRAAETRAPVDNAAGTSARADKVEKTAHDAARDVAIAANAVGKE